MNQDKIGKFIAELRKNKKLTQTELAKRIGVSNKTVSKWECGNAIPDYGVFENLCKEFNISVNELLNGEKDMKDDKVIGEYMKMKGKQNCLKILVVVIICILVILCVIFGTYFFNSYKSITMYEFVGENENFGYKNATYLESKIKTVFTGGQFSILNNTISEKDIIDKKLVIKENDKYYWFGNVYAGSLNYEDYLYGDTFSLGELKHLPNDLYLIVWYRFDGEILYDVIELKSKLILSNDKLVDFKIEHIAEDPNYELVNEIILDKYNSIDIDKYKNQLLEQGFVPATKEDAKQLYGLKENGLIKKNGKETIFVDYINYILFYSVVNKDYTIHSVAKNNDFKHNCNTDNIGLVDLYVSGKIDGQDYYTRAYEGCSGTYIKGELPVDISDDLERFKEVNKLYAYKDE